MRAWHAPSYRLLRITALHAVPSRSSRHEKEDAMVTATNIDETKSCTTSWSGSPQT